MMLAIASLATFLLAAGVNAAQTSSPFVSRQGMRFYENGKETFVFSANYWQAMNLGAVDSAQGNRTRLLLDLDNLQRMGVNNLRLMAASEGPNGQPFRMNPALMDSPGVYNEAVLDGLDFALAEMAKRGLKAVMCMNNFWQWSGGFSQYVSWVTNTSIPYPPSWDPKLGDYTQGQWEPFTTYSARFYTDDNVRPQAQKIYRDHISTIVNRRNKYTGVLYKDDPTIFSWELANEPQLPPRNWVEDTARYIKSIAPNHMVTVGLESKYNEQDFRDAHGVDAVDYATVHIWVQNAGVYNMLDKSEGNIKNAIDWALRIVDSVNGWSQAISKPLVLEEFGMARDNWVAPNKSSWYSPNNPTTNKDRYYGALLTRVAESHKQGGAYAGFGFWAYSGAARPGDHWIADPPHEAPGWYSVYDKDSSTINVMKAALNDATSP